ncbi:MAG: 50S ribosomal protein L5, partial [Bacilli bacterium]
MADEKKPVAAKAPKAEKAPKATAPKAEKAVKAVAPKAEAKAPKAEKKAAKAENPDKYENRLIKKYRDQVVPALIKKFGYTSLMQCPKLEKIVINIGVGDATQNAKALE